MDALLVSLFGTGCGIALWFATASRDPYARHLALSLFVVWALMNVAWLLNAMWVFPLVDLWSGLLGLSAWWAGRTDWAAIFCKTVFVRLELHVLDSLTGHAFLVSYIHALNATFVWMLVVVAYPGGGYAPDLVRRYLRRVGGIRKLAVARGALIHGR